MIASVPVTVKVMPVFTVKGPVALALVLAAISQLVAKAVLLTLKMSVSPLVVSPVAPDEFPKK
tara:strand:+ start:329 stop:517 length:189 start_codon:yes stop_codon:yes gene_type:complete